MTKQNGFQLIHRADLLNLLRGLFTIYRAEGNEAALDVLRSIAVMIGLPGELDRGQ